MVLLDMPPLPLTLPPSLDINAIDVGFKVHLSVQWIRPNGTTDWINMPQISNTASLFRLIINNTLFPSNATCTTPNADQLVKLPMVHASAFTQIGDTHGEKEFELTLTNCPQYMNSIRYKLYSTHPPDNTNAANAANGLVSLSNDTGSASGIKVQILDRDTDTPITLDQFRVVSNYSPSNYNNIPIRFKARYYQSESQVTSGTVRATAFVQILYQ